MNHGYTNVMNMEHGMNRWLQKGFPTKGNASAVPIQNTGCCCETSTTEKVETSCCSTTASDTNSSCCEASESKERFNSDQIEGISCC